MSVTLNTNNFNSQYKSYQYNNYKNANKPAFEGRSPFLDKWKIAKKRMDAKIGNFMAKHYNSKFYQSVVTEKIAKFVEKHNLNRVVEHMQAINSAIISGMYMSQTLRNKDLDPEKKKTLAINQFLTFALSTYLSYKVNAKLDEKWEKLTRRYAVANLEQERTKDMTKAERKAHKKAKLEELNQKIKEWDISEKAKFDAKVASGEISADSKYVEKTVLDYVTKKMANPKLTKQIDGMGVLKKLFVFTTIYRFIAPVAVTPVANWIGNKYIYSKNDKK